MGGAKGSIHRPANDVNSTWGWSARQNVFLPNFSSAKTNQSSCWTIDRSSSECVPPFQGFPLGWDAMVGGEPLYPSVNRFTTYTPSVSMGDGYWGPSIAPPAASANNAGRYIEITSSATYNTTLTINGQSITISTGDHKLYQSNGSLWLATAQPAQLCVPRLAGGLRFHLRRRQQHAVWQPVPVAGANQQRAAPLPPEQCAV
jgi:hypothetical protein